MANNTTFNIKRGIEEIKQIFEDKVKMKAIKIDVKFNSFFNNYVVKTDMKRMQQVLLNIYSNAIKFTGRNGNITLKVDQIFVNRKNMLMIEVQDDGLGIKKED